jgi:hypothetical protein
MKNLLDSGPGVEGRAGMRCCDGTRGGGRKVDGDERASDGSSLPGDTPRGRFPEEEQDRLTAELVCMVLLKKKRLKYIATSTIPILRVLY